MKYIIDAMRDGDWEQVRAIYLEGIATGNATFETAAPAWEKWHAVHLDRCRLIARAGETVCGWAALGRISARRVYAGVAEVSLYVAAINRGHGIGRALLERLITESEQSGIWTLQAGILAENHASLAVHRQCGFRDVGRRERIGQLHGVWRDVLLLERRSPVVGLD